MRVVAALGGNALLERDELPESRVPGPVIGQLGDAEALLRGDAGTVVAA